MTGTHGRSGMSCRQTDRIAASRVPHHLAIRTLIPVPGTTHFRLQTAEDLVYFVAPHCTVENGEIGYGSSGLLIILVERQVNRKALFKASGGSSIPLACCGRASLSAGDSEVLLVSVQVFSKSNGAEGKKNTIGQIDSKCPWLHPTGQCLRGAQREALPHRYLERPI